jgi:hypothetical protein
MLHASLTNLIVKRELMGWIFCIQEIKLNLQTHLLIQHQNANQFTFLFCFNKQINC